MQCIGPNKKTTIQLSNNFLTFIKGMLLHVIAFFMVRKPKKVLFLHWLSNQGGTQNVNLAGRRKEIRTLKVFLCEFTLVINITQGNYTLYLI